jgi:hypothetical protein
MHSLEATEYEAGMETVKDIHLTDLSVWPVGEPSDYLYTGAGCGMVKTLAFAESPGWVGWLRRFVRPARHFDPAFHFVCVRAGQWNEPAVQPTALVFEVDTPAHFATWVTSTFDAQGGLLASSGAGVGPPGQPAPDADQVDRLAAEGRAVLARLHSEHPEWFAAHIEYPVEDFSPPDLSDVTIDFGE